MQKDSTLYNFIQTLQGQVFYAAFLKNLSDEQRQDWTTRSPIMSIKRGYAESPNWIFVQALEFLPDGLSVEKFRQRAVYSAPNLTLALLELLASDGYFDPINGEYHLTDKGHAESEKIKNFRINTFNGFTPIAPDIPEKIEKSLSKVIVASLANKEVNTWCLVHSRKRAPENDAPALAKIVQYGSDFNAFRDDAHMKAFGEYDVQGHIWEAFSVIKIEQAQTVADLYEKLAYRGFYTQDWQSALDNLVGRAWLTEDKGQYTVSEAGIDIFEDVEAKTDAYFYAPWDVLSDNEYNELIDNIQKLSDTCKALTAS